MIHIDDFSGNATDPLSNGKVKYWREIVSDILVELDRHNNLILQVKKKDRAKYKSNTIESCMLSIGALSLLTEKVDDDFSFKEKYQARSVILESLNLCEKLQTISDT